MEEASELLERLDKKENLPMFTSCCPSWVKYVEMFHPNLIPNLSTTLSPIAINSALINSYFKEFNNIEEDIITVAVAPCTSKKYETKYTDTDYVITTLELAMMIRECNIDIKSLKHEDYDILLRNGSRDANIFGRSGGVMEAALNTAYYLKTGKTPKESEFYLEQNNGIEKASYKIGDRIINIGVVYGMKNVEEIIKDMDEYDFIEVMNCPSGCIGGGGGPLSNIAKLKQTRDLRVHGLDNIDTIYKHSYETNEIKELYNSYLVKPLSNKAHELLHTKHEDKSYLIKNKEKVD